jgi:hypothetical protein
MSHLLKERTKSCGCLSREAAAAKRVTHGDTIGHRNAPEYDCYKNMIGRCYRPTLPTYKRYGARGIRVCERWRDSYENFIADMGRRPSPDHSIDRIDNDGHYEPGNCRWATREQQGTNTRRTRHLTLNGKTPSLSQWARRLGVCDETIRGRLARGWPVEAALTEPMRPTRNKRKAG